MCPIPINTPRSHLLGDGSGASSSTGAPPGQGPRTTTSPAKKRPARQKTTNEAADAILKKAAIKVDEQEGLRSLLIRGGMCLGFELMVCFQGLTGNLIFEESLQVYPDHTRGPALADACMKDLEPYGKNMKDARAHLKNGLDSQLAEARAYSRPYLQVHIYI